MSGFREQVKNYKQIKQDVWDIVKEELARIEADPELRKLLRKEE